MATPASIVEQDSAKLTWGLAAAIVISVFVVYANSLHVPFVLDDRRNIVDNPFIQHLWPLSKAMQAPPQSGVAGRPIVSLSLALNYAISGLDVWSYHLFNIAIHAACALLVFGIITRALRAIRTPTVSPRHCRLIAFFAGFLWAIHPLQTMCVTYVIQRAESLMAMFLLLTVYASMRSLSRRRSGWNIVAIISCAMGMGCKEVMVVAPCMVFIFDRVLCFSTLRDQWRSRRWLYAGLAATWAILIALNYSGPRGESAGSGLAGTTALQYLQTQSEVILLYFWKSIWPRHLCLDYDWPIEHRALFIAIPAMIVLSLVLWTLLGIARRRPASLLGAWFFLILAPTSTFVPISVIASEHRMYLPLAAVTLAAVLAGRRIIPSLRSAQTGTQLQILAFSVVALALAIRIWQRNETYQSPLSIWSDVVAQRPANLRARNNLGNELRRTGQPAEAVEQYRFALKSDPNYFDANYNLAVACLDLDRVAEALPALQTAVRSRPEDPLAQCILGHVLRRLDQPREGLPHLQRALELRPNFARARLELAIAHAYAGNPDDALPSLETAVRQDASDAGALTALAWILATHPDSVKRNPAAALTLAQRADTLTAHADPRALDAIAAAHADAGNFESAVQTATQAEKLATAAGRTAYAAEIHERINLYQHSKPFHSP